MPCWASLCLGRRRSRCRWQTRRKHARPASKANGWRGFIQSPTSFVVTGNCCIQLNACANAG
eukprot:7606486-Lingulodinium_polyedra.AAC.1